MMRSIVLSIVFIAVPVTLALEYAPDYAFTEVPDPLSGNNPRYPLVPLAEPDPGVEYFEPSFGTILFKATTRDYSHSRHEYSRFDPFNVDQSRILLDPSDGWDVYSTASIPFNTTANLVIQPSLSEPRWDPSNANLLWGFSDFSIVTLDVTTGDLTIIVDFTQDPIIGPLIASSNVYRITCKDEGEPSVDMRYWGLMLQGDVQEDYEPLYVFCWDRLTASTLGVRTLQENERLIDWVGMSWHGNYLLIGSDYNNGGPLAGLVMATRDLTQFHRLDYATAHSDVGLDAQGREVIVMQNINTDFIDMIPIDFTTQPILEAGGSYEGTNRTPLIRLFYDFGSPYGLQSGVHVSCNHAGYAVVSTYIQPFLPEKNWLDRSIVLVTLDDAAARVVYLAKTPNTTAEYWEETHASITRDGSRVVWAENWGIDPGVVDMFLMSLRMPQGGGGLVDIELEMPATAFGEGDPCGLTLGMQNPGGMMTADLYVLLDVAGQFFSYPAWQAIGNGLSHETISIPAGVSSKTIIPDFIMPAVSPFGPMHFYAALFTPGLLGIDALISDVATFDFSLN